ncbi:MAG: UDP-N-acetylmuramate--L-alanine ligase [Nocardioides sp.]
MKLPVPDHIDAPDRLGRVHFVGIGGAGLSAMARIMLARGIEVSGSDGRDSETLGSLRRAGARVDVGHHPDRVIDADTVVVSTAIPESNPEVVAALAAGKRVWPRSAAMASLMLDSDVLAVAGTHGKTTTTSLLTVALRAAGLDPSYTIGGDLAQTGTNAAAGTGRYFVAEADESDGAFLAYTPFAAIVTNVDADHLDHFGTEDAYRQSFDAFAARIRPDGFLVCVADDPGARELAARRRAAGAEVLTVGESAAADLRAVDLEFDGATSRFDVRRGRERWGSITLRIPGRHYVVDALAALALGLRLDQPFDALAAGMAGFTGTKRRMEAKGEAGGVRVYDSYAHHPSEIAADLEAARAVAGAGRLIVVFQPHLASRTRIFGAQMGEALRAADEVIVLDVYLAREAADPGVTGAVVVAAVGDRRARFEPDFAAAAGLAAECARPGDLVLTLGAGNVTELGPEILRLLDGTGRG